MIAAVNAEEIRPLRLRCPACWNSFPEAADHTRLTCSGCGFSMPEENGIVRALTPESKSRFEQFLRNYRAVRAKEGWGCGTADYYLALPFKDLTHKHDWIWRIRARTLLYMQNHILPKIGSAKSSSCRVLDIGAGNGWLSYRLAKNGYSPTAVDLLDDDADGLSAARHYLAQMSPGFSRFQADMDHLPFESGQFDVAIFNASFHYSSDYETTLREVIRCLRRPGIVIVADSPFYWHDESGKQMLEERRARFERQFGVCEDSSHGSEYVTPQILNELAARLMIRWNVGKPWYGIRWALRPAKARLLGRREPSKFYLHWFRVGG